jgi:uncharacterized membrane protein YedE/YeeE
LWDFSALAPLTGSDVYLYLFRIDIGQSLRLAAGGTMKNAVAFVTGLIFALGLGLSGMTQPHIVKGFLDLGPDWNWSLLGVMAGAIGVHGLAFRLIRRAPSPLFASGFDLPKKSNIDLRLVIGASIFGLGWGWAGICPGPGIVGVASGKQEYLLFVGAMIVGMKIFQIISRRFVWVR